MTPFEKSSNEMIQRLSLLVMQKKCNQIKALKWIHYKPSLFQHVGTTSSLKGKVQKLKVSRILT